MITLGVALVAAYGVHLVFTACAFGWSGVGPAPRLGGSGRVSLSVRVGRWMTQAGLVGVSVGEFVAVSLVLLVTGVGAGWALFGGVLPGLGVGLFAASAPLASYRVRRGARMAAASEAWPHMIEEIRVMTGAAGRSIPQALLEVGLRGPEELRPAFVAAQREWLLSTDFGRCVGVLKELLADPTADATCETLLVAHDIGGSDLDGRLAELAEDRRADTLGRKDARSKQAGVRFARWFVVVVPLGMALAGLSLGDGRVAYQSGAGQVLVVIGIGLMAACWVWSGRMLRLPEARRVFG